jgi:hypothetical protein
MFNFLCSSIFETVNEEENLCALGRVLESEGSVCGFLTVGVATCFNHLIYLSLDRTMPAFRQPSKTEIMPHHQAIVQIVQTCGDVCPTLKTCSFCLCLEHITLRIKLTSAVDHAWKKLDESWENIPSRSF